MMRGLACIAAFGLLYAQAAPTITERDEEEPYIQLKLWSDLTGYVKACSAYINNVSDLKHGNALFTIRLPHG